MATIPVWIQLKSPPRIRKIEATSLTWVFGTRVSATVLYGTSSTAPVIETFSQVIESAPTTGTAVALVKSITVGAEQIAIELPADSTSAVLAQLSPYARNSSAAVVTAANGVGRNLVAPPRLQILDMDIFRYVRFTGTELPAAGIIIPVDSIIAMFTTEPSASQL